MSFRTQYRGSEDWIETTGGCIRLNTASNEAAKCYDATVTQIVGYYQDPQFVGGSAGSCKRMLSSDPNFVLGRALELEMKLIGPISSIRNDQRLARLLDALNTLVANDPEGLTHLEQLHVEAVNHLAVSNFKRAAATLERLVTLYPEDVWALKILQHTYIKLGSTSTSLGSLAYAVPRMSASNPLIGFAHGMYSYAFEESNMYDRAQAEAQIALDINPMDTWAIHSYAHTFEMRGLSEEGLKYMEDQEPNFLPCEGLASHQLWHKALFQINNEQFDEAVFLLDTELMPRCKRSSNAQNWASASTLLYRMELINLVGQVRTRRDDNPDRWATIYEMCKPHENDHIWAWYDAVYMMSYLGMNDMTTAEEFIKSIDEECSMNSKTEAKVVLQAMLDFKLANYEQCAEKLAEMRHDIIKVGGSHVQRDCFEQLLAVAAKKSPRPEHNRLAERMLLERDAIAGRRLPLTDHLGMA